MYHKFQISMTAILEIFQLLSYGFYFFYNHIMKRIKMTQLISITWGPLSR